MRCCKCDARDFEVCKVWVRYVCKDCRGAHSVRVGVSCASDGLAVHSTGTGLARFSLAAFHA